MILVLPDGISIVIIIVLNLEINLERTDVCMILNLYLEEYAMTAFIQVFLFLLKFCSYFPIDFEHVLGGLFYIFQIQLLI